MDPNTPQDLPAWEPVPEPPAPTGWLAPATLPPAPGAPTGKVAPLYDLRPLTTGEVLDRTFSVYRSRFWLFAGIAAISGAVQLVTSAAQMVVQHFVLHGIRFGRFNITTMIMSFVAGVLFMLAYSITQAATVFAVGEIYLGRNTSIAESWRATANRWLTYVGIGIWQLGSFIWAPLILLVPAFALFGIFARGRANNPGMLALAGILMFVGILGGSVVGFILLIRNLLAVPSTVVEKLKVRQSMRRSKVLAAGAKGRIFLVGVITYCLYLVVGVLQAPLVILTLTALRKGHESIAAQAGTLIIGFLGHSVVTPVAMIGFTLIYIDQRVRKEAFDIVVLLGENQPIAAEPTPPFAPSISEAPVSDGTAI